MNLQVRAEMLFTEEQMYQAISDRFRHEYGSYPDEIDEFHALTGDLERAHDDADRVNAAERRYWTFGLAGLEDRLAHYVQWAADRDRQAASGFDQVFSVLASPDEELAEAQRAQQSYDLFRNRAAAMNGLGAKLTRAREELLAAVSSSHVALIEEVCGEQIRAYASAPALDPGTSLYDALYALVRETVRSPAFHARWEQAFAEAAAALRRCLDEAAQNLPPDDGHDQPGGSWHGWAQVNERLEDFSAADDEDAFNSPRRRRL